LSRHSVISPALRFDLSLEVDFPQPTLPKKAFRLLSAPLKIGMRKYAKRIYRELTNKKPENPLVGPVSITWSGWKHLTRTARRQSHITDSLRLLGLLEWAIANPTRFSAVRRLPRIVRGAWVQESRFLVFDCEQVPLEGRPPSDIKVVLKERVTYPADWLNNIQLHKKVTRTVSFFSIYEKTAMP
jgi:hypothetical protein